MKVPLWAHETAAFFWEAVGAPEPFPRSLRASILRSPFELTVKEMSGLTATAAAQYLGRLSPGWACGGLDRPLRACLAARDGAGFILLDAADVPAERVFSLAHELAHFLWHYLRPRQWAGRCVGPGAAEVFDGRREPTSAELLRALLGRVPLGQHVHWMERGSRRQILDERIAVAEEEADRLAYELLAPAAAVWAADKDGADPRGLATRLEEDFGLPHARAEDYGRLLKPPSYTDPLILRFRARR